MKQRAQFAECPPLRHRFEVIDRFGGFHLDNAQELPSSILRLQDEIGIPWRLTCLDRCRLLIARIDGNLEFSSIFRLKQANKPIMLKLLPNRAQENGAQQDLRSRRKPGEYSMRIAAP